MKQKLIAIIDYGMGNIGSVEHAVKSLGGLTVVSNDVAVLAKADGFILPGVGAFPKAMANIKSLHLDVFLNDQILDLNKPILGICLGMQIMAQSSTEQELTEGFGWYDAKVVKLDASDSISVPHVGWNNVSFEPNDVLFNNIELGSHFFFDHSYHMVCGNGAPTPAYCSHGSDVTAAMSQKNIFSTQFHPEKSQRNGLKLLRNFLNLVENNQRSAGVEA